MAMKIVLASLSKYRAKQLSDFGIEFTTCRPLADEEYLKKQNKHLSPRALSRFLAFKKAESVRYEYPADTVIIGADQLIQLGSRILGKPKTAPRARAMLQSMSGRKHQLITSMCVYCNGLKLQSTVVANITLRRLSSRQIADYVKRDKPLDCAGSYKFECGGLSLVKKISVSDPSSLTGLSLISLTNLLLEMDHIQKRWKRKKT